MRLAVVGQGAMEPAVMDLDVMGKVVTEMGAFIHRPVGPCMHLTQPPPLPIITAATTLHACDGAGCDGSGCDYCVWCNSCDYDENCDNDEDCDHDASCECPLLRATWYREHCFN
jgi:hypothetical protein